MPLDYIRWGPSSPPIKGHSPPQFSANVHCGQTVGWTKVPRYRGRPRPRRLCSMGTQLLPETRAHPIFGLCLLRRNSWMDENATWYGSRLGLDHIVLDGCPSSPQKGHSSPPFGPCLLWPRSPISATAELLLFSVIIITD